MEIARLAEDENLIEQRRKQLADLSTFMRELNESEQLSTVASKGNQAEGGSRSGCKWALDCHIEMVCPA